jgi:hypothetical protein
MGTIRLACLLCDRDDGDGLECLPTDWMDIDEVQSYEDAVEVSADLGDRSLDWWTHLGVCPACQETRYAPTETFSSIH